MRVSRWLLGCVGLGVLLAATGICSLTAFFLTRQAVVDLQGNGILLDDPLAALRCVASGQCEADPSRLAPAAEAAPLLALTPLFTAIPTEVSPMANATAVLAPPATVMQVPAAPTPTLDPGRSLPRITDPRQIRILLLGVDQRSAAEESGPFRTDTMILMNIDPVHKTVGVLSLPARSVGEHPRFWAWTHQYRQFYRRCQCLSRRWRAGPGHGNRVGEFRHAGR